MSKNKKISLTAATFSLLMLGGRVAATPAWAGYVHQHSTAPWNAPATQTPMQLADDGHGSGHGDDGDDEDDEDCQKVAVSGDGDNDKDDFKKVCEHHGDHDGHGDDGHGDNGHGDDGHGHDGHGDDGHGHDGHGDDGHGHS